MILLENRYRGVIEWGLWSEVAQDLQAVLVGHCEGVDLMDTSPLSDLARQFVQKWWGKFLPIFRGLDQYNEELRGTNLWKNPREIVWPEHELPPEDSHDDCPEERKWHQEAADQAARDDLEERELLEAVTRHQEEMRAAEYQQWERAAMHEEMEASGTKRPRLRLTMEIGGSGASTSSTTRRSTITFPPPPVGEGVHVHLHLEQILEEVRPDESEQNVIPTEHHEPIHVPDSLDLPQGEEDEEAQGDDVQLMQTTRSGRGLCTVADLKQWLKTVAKPFRQRVIAGLLQLLRGRQLGLQSCLRFLETQLERDAIEQTMLQFAQDIAASEDDSQPIMVPESAGTLDSEPRRRRTASSSTAMPYQDLESAAGHGVTACASASPIPCYKETLSTIKMPCALLRGSLRARSMYVLRVYASS